MIANAVRAYKRLIETTFHISIQTFWEHFIALSAGLLTILALYWQLQHLYQRHTSESPTP